MKTKVDKLLKKLNKHSVDNDKEFLECLIDLDDRVKQLEKNHTPNDIGENKLNGGKSKMKWKCRNCANIFESEDGLEKEEFKIHIYDCMDSDDFFYVI